MVLRVAESFAGQRVLLTGSTGFMGKVLVEKLLRSCPDLGHLYLLARGRKGSSAHDRMQEIFRSPLFCLIEKENPKFREKVTIMEGDVSRPGLGLSRQDTEIVCNQVTVVIHTAATVRFDEPLKVAHEINVRGTKEVLLLAKRIKGIKALAHTSTAYSQPQVNLVEERLYEVPMDEAKLSNIVHSLDPAIITDIQTKLMGRHFNTYTFTKAIAEGVVKELGEDLPVLIFRPGVVAASAHEPLPGWLDNINGPNGLITGCYTGIIHVVYGDKDIPSNLVPVDMADNALLAATADMIQRGPCGEIPVYNYTSSCNPLTYRHLQKMLEIHGHKAPPLQNLWIYFVISTCNSLLYLLLSMVFHYLPALIIDSIGWLFQNKTNKGTSLVQVYKKVDKFSEVTRGFSVSYWDWSWGRVGDLHRRLSPADKEAFKFDMVSLEWNEYMAALIRGVRVHLLKEDVSNVPAALTRYRRLEWIHFSLKCVLGLTLLPLSYSLSHFMLRLFGIIVQ